MTWNGTVVDPDDSQQVACTSDATATSTSNVTISGLSATIAVAATDEVWIVHLEPDISLSGTNPFNIVELLVDGSAQAVQILSFASTGNSPRNAASKTYRLTGLSAGSHTISARTRMTNTGMTGVIHLGHSTMTVTRNPRRAQ